MGVEKLGLGMAGEVLGLGVGRSRYRDRPVRRAISSQSRAILFRRYGNGIKV